MGKGVSHNFARSFSVTETFETFQCDICGKNYNTKEQAEKCEVKCTHKVDPLGTHELTKSTVQGIVSLENRLRGRQGVIERTQQMVHELGRRTDYDHNCLAEQFGKLESESKHFHNAIDEHFYRIRCKMDDLNDECEKGSGIALIIAVALAISVAGHIAWIAHFIG